MVRAVPHFTPTTPDVSVLMVAHDVEKTVRRAVESIQNQTLRNLELVVVDAGSSDSTLRQLETMSERDIRVEVVHAGACSRQEGLDLALERARGTYLTVMDPDAVARPTMLSAMLALASDKSLDLVIGGFTLALFDRGLPLGERVVVSEDVSYPTQHDFRADSWRLLASGQLLPASAKLFSRAWVTSCGARFSADPQTDHGFMVDVLRNVERVGVLSGECYRLDRALVPPRRIGGVPNSYLRLEREHNALLGLYRGWGLDGDAATMGALQNRYVEQLVACVEEVCGSRTRTGAAEQRRVVSAMLGTEHARLAVSVARPKGSLVRSMLAPIRSQNVALVCAQARLLSLIWHGRATDMVPDLFV